MERKKEVIIVIIVFLVLLGVVVFLLNRDDNTSNIDTITFKNEYESLNDKKINNDLKYPTVNVSEDINIKYTTIKESIDILSRSRRNPRPGRRPR